jgi:hypothetical protein
MSERDLAKADLEMMLQALADLHHQREAVERDLQAKRDEIMTPEILQALADLGTEFEPMFVAVDGLIGRAREELAKMTVAFGSTVAFAGWQAVFVQGSDRWDGAKLEGFAIIHPEIRACMTPGKPSAQLRRVKVK